MNTSGFCTHLGQKCQLWQRVSLPKIINKLPKYEITTVTGNLNAKFEKGKEDEHAGTSKKRADLLSSLATEHQLVVLRLTSNSTQGEYTHGNHRQTTQKM